MKKILLIIIAVMLVLVAMPFLMLYMASAAPPIFPPLQGGTGTSTVPTADQILIGGDTSGRYDIKLLQGGSGITLATTSGKVTVSLGSLGASASKWATSTAVVTAIQPAGALSLLVGAGTLSNPSYAFTTDTDSGLLNSSPSNIAFVIDGVQVITFGSANMASAVNFVAPLGTAAGPSYTWDAGASQNTGFHLAAVDTIGISNDGVKSILIGPTGDFLASSTIQSTGLGRFWGGYISAASSTVVGDFTNLGTFKVGGVSNFLQVDSTGMLTTGGTGGYNVGLDRNAFCNTPFTSACLNFSSTGAYLFNDSAGATSFRIGAISGVASYSAGIYAGNGFALGHVSGGASTTCSNALCVHGPSNFNATTSVAGLIATGTAIIAGNLTVAGNEVLTGNLYTSLTGKVSIGTTTLSSFLTTQSNATGTRPFQVATSSRGNVFYVNDDGHIGVAGWGTPTASCGTGATIRAGSSDGLGEVTVGTLAITSCSINFARTWNLTPVCIVAVTNNVTGVQYSMETPGTSVTKLTFQDSLSNAMDGDTFAWDCKEFASSK